MQIDRMELADIANPTAIAEAICKQLRDIQIPVAIDEIAKACGITDIQAVETDSFEGALIAPDHKQDGIIVVNTKSIPERQRFTIGHELGHFMNPWHTVPAGGFKCTAEDMLARSVSNAGQRKIEAEANEFSAAMLMPKKQFLQDVRRIKDPCLEHIVELSKRYKTSKLATGRRFVDLSDDAFAVVLTKNGSIEQMYRNKRFPYVNLQRGQVVHRNTLTATFNGPDDDCSNMDAAEAAMWLSSGLKNNAELFEQVLIQKNGYRLTLLCVDETNVDDDDDDEEDGHRSNWNPKFR